MKGIKITVALTAVEKECLVLSLILLVAFAVQRNVQGARPLKQYRCHRAARISEDFCEARQFFGNTCLPATSIKPWNRMEKS